MKFNFNLKYFISGLLLVLLVNYNTFIPAKTVTSETSTSSSTKAELWDIKESIDNIELKPYESRVYKLSLS